MSEPLEPRPVVRALKDENKIGALFGLIAIDKRQLLVMIGCLFGCFMLFGALNPIFHLNAVQNLLVFGPLVSLVFFLSFIKIDGRYIDFWARKAVSRALKPNKFRWRKRPPGEQRHVRDAVQAVIPADQILWQMLRTIDGQYVMIFELELLNLSLASEDQRIRVEKGAQALYNRASTFPFQELTVGKGRDTKLLARRLAEDIHKNIPPEEASRRAYAVQKAQFYAELGSKYGAQDRRAYVILPYKPAQPIKGVSQVAFASKAHAQALQYEARQAYAKLRVNANILRDGYKDMGIHMRALVKDNLMSFIKEQSSGDLRPEHVVSVMPKAKSDVVDLQFGQYEKVSDQKLSKIIKAQNEIRKDEPPAVGIGDLQLVDRISPDALEVRDDAIRVGDKWRQGLFAYELPDEISFGVLTRLTNWSEPLKITKHIRPIGREAAIHQLGGVLAELGASKDTADRGDLVENEQRDKSFGTTRWALRRILQGKENLFKVSLYAELEHENMRNLKAMMRELEAEFSACQIQTKTCRQEAWESYITNLPLAKNLCDTHYAESGLMTDALATLFSFGSQQINHPRGVLMGKDRESSNLVVLDTALANNPHVVVIGDTGAGKTFSLKQYTTTLNIRGHRIVVIDPVGNSKYGRVAQQMNGEFIELRPGTDHHINPCDLRGGYMNLSYFSGDIDDHGREEELLFKARQAALSAKKTVLTEFISLMATNKASAGLTVEEQSFTEMAWGEVYASKGIYDDPETHNNQPPTCHDFFLYLHEHKDSNQIAKGLLSKLYTWDTVEKGSLSEYVRHQTSVNLDSKYLVIRVSDLDQRAKRPMEFALLDFLVPILSNPEEPAALDFEELWDILNADEEDPVKKRVEEFCRSGRARRCALLAASQHPSEFLQSSVGKVLLDQADTKLILKIKGGALNTIQDLYGFSHEEAQRIKHAAKGDYTLLIGDDIQIPIKGLASQYEQELFNTDPDKEEKFNAQRRARQASIDAGAAAGATVVPSVNGASSTTGAPVSRLTASERLRTILGEAPPPQNPHTGSETGQPKDSVNQSHQPAAGGPTEDGHDQQDDRSQDHSNSSASSNAEPSPAELSNSRPPLQISSSERGRIYAFVGPQAYRMAYHAAGLLARSNEDQNVLLVDAAGGISNDIWSHNWVAPDTFIDNHLQGNMKDYVAISPALGLHIMFYTNKPESQKPGPLTTYVRQNYGAIIVACGDTPYAEHWLTAADRVIATAENPRELKYSLEEAERLRGSNGTFVAPVGSISVPSALRSHPVYNLPDLEDGTYFEAEQSTQFATLMNDLTGAAFTDLMDDLLQTADNHQVEEGSIAVKDMPSPERKESR